MAHFWQMVFLVWVFYDVFGIFFPRVPPLDIFSVGRVTLSHLKDLLLDSSCDWELPALDSSYLQEDFLHHMGSPGVIRNHLGSPGITWGHIPRVTWGQLGPEVYSSSSSISYSESISQPNQSVNQSISQTVDRILSKSISHPGAPEWVRER